MYGGPGRDTMHGGEGNDTTDGQGGGDTLVGGPGRDMIIAGTGSGHLIYAEDGEQDLICVSPAAAGRVVTADRKDEFIDNRSC
jgi:Ca2+-binding RTX toxin-like protein